MVLHWVLRNNFYRDIVSLLTKNTSDPKRTAYLRLPFRISKKQFDKNIKFIKKGITFI